jgi:sugar phosphate isomerase/epimerase
MKLSFSTWGMRATPIDDAVRHCAALGYDGLELTIIPGWPTDAATTSEAERRRIRQLYDDAGIELCGISGNVSLLNDDPRLDLEQEETFRRCLDFAAEIQHPAETLIVTTVSGGKSGEWEDEKHRFVEIVGRLSEYAHEHGVMVGIEPHVAHALRTPGDARWLVEQIDSPGMTVHFDISHFNVQGIPMEESVAALTPISLHTHVKDERGIYPRHEFLVPGEGEMDYPRYLQLMADAGYDGHIVVEISVMVQSRPGYDALAAATQSYDVLARAFETARIPRSRR